MEKETASKRLETCEEKGCVKLFGVIISDQNQYQSMQNSHSTANLEPPSERNVPVKAELRPSKVKVHLKKRKAVEARGINVKRWTEFEHQEFLKGLKFCGKGDWKGISKYFVPTRTPKQVASHAQKYFLAHASSYRRNYRSSIFDMPLKQPAQVRERAQRCLGTSKTQPLSFIPKLNHLRAAYVFVPRTFGNLKTKAPVTAASSFGTFHRS